VTGVTSWPVWATAKIDDLSRTEARNCLVSAQAFWRDFAIAGLTLPELRLVIEERRRKGPGGRITVASPAPKTIRQTRSLDAPDNSLFDSFPPLDPDDPRWIHA
jgi:hypothetical protein